MRTAVVTESARADAQAAAPPGLRVAGWEALPEAGFALVGSGDEGLERLRDAPGLEVVQVLSAGTDWIEAHLPDGAELRNARGARDAPVAEWCAGALLGASSGLLRAAREPRWEHRRPAELADWTVVVLGHGSIGRALEARLAPFGPTVVGVARTARDGVRGVDELPALLPQADALVVLAPLTDATRGLVAARELALLRDGALVLNAGRGPVVDAEALLAELQAGRLRAALDVTDPEPLPDDHPLWRAPGTLAITSHQSGDSEAADERARALAVASLVAWATGG